MSVEFKKGNKSIVVDKAYDFALLIITIYKELKTHNEYVLSKQILRSGTSIGANVNEARETKYWLSLLKDSNFIYQEMYDKSNTKCEELIKILSSIILTTKQRYLNNS